MNMVKDKAISSKQRSETYDIKVIIKGTLEDVIQASVLIKNSKNEQ
jgi:hypothetical protein